MPEKTPLHFAALSAGDALGKLLQSGADPNVADPAGRTPLHNACEKAPQHIPLLLAAGAGPNAKDHNGMSPLHYAAIFNVGGCRPLLEAPVDLNAQDINGHTALFHAVFLGRSESAGELLQAGADPGVPDFSGETLFMHIHPHIGPGTIDNLWTVDAMMHGPKRIATHLKVLVDEGNEVRIRRVLRPEDEPGYFWPCRDRGTLSLSGWSELGDLLSSYCRQRSAWRCLYVFHTCGLPMQLPEALRSGKVDLDALEDVANGQVEMALIQAASEGGCRVPLLLQLHAEECAPAVNAALLVLCSCHGVDGASARNPAKDALQSLLRAGASLEARSEAVAGELHQTLQQPVAEDGGLHWEASAQYLSFAGFMMGLCRPTGFTPLLQAAESCSLLVEDLLAAGANIETTDRFGRNALHLCAGSAKSENANAVMAILVHAGLPVDGYTPNGWRALTLAGHARVVRFLLEQGASPVVTAEEGRRLGVNGAQQLQDWIRRAL